MTYKKLMYSGIKPAKCGLSGGQCNHPVHWRIHTLIVEMSYILLMASGLHYTGILVKIQDEIVYTLAFKAT